ncbi:unnamed protein product [Rotaria sordida]|uniref:Uncharacterized protein n=1 Tax=Rotaria sordida TaxID=392033 RepID=A0A815PX82_9BILA|nr:unnamed protein product [Rotaria sordida]CAF1640451.1 unnamed protein product [Rotaria sordida]
MGLNRDGILRYIVAIHFLCTNMALITDWLPMSYILSQVTIIVLGFWAVINRDSAILVELLMLVEFFSIILDAIGIGMHFQIARRAYLVTGYSSNFVLSAIFAIFLLLLKPIILLLLNKVRQDRLGDAASPTFGGWGPNTPTPVPGYTPVDEQTA